MVRSLSKRGMPKWFAILVASLLALYFVPLNALPANAADDVQIVPGGENCNGIITTPGSENTLKDIVGGDLQPGGTVTFRISYPANPADVGNTFQITDCFMKRIAGTPGVDYKANTLDPLPGSPFTINFVPNNDDFTFDYTLDIPSSVPVGTEICNYAKTTEGPSDPQASNRKGGICFTVGGTLRIEKRDAQTNAVLQGAKFSVSCNPTATFPSLVISGLETARPDGAPVSGNPATGYANEGFIAIAGPEGTPCTVTELEAPPGGYVMPNNVSRTYTIPRSGSTDATKVFLNTRTGALRIIKIADATGSFTFDVSCTDGTNKQNIPISINANQLGGDGVSAPLIDGIPTGTVCTVTEDDNALFSTTVNPQNGVVTIGSGTNTVTFTNTRKTGSLKITKIADAAGSFTFDVSCTDGTNPQNIPITIDGAHLNTGVSAPLISGIPTGTVCTVSEDGNELFTTTVAPVSGQVTIDNGTKEVTFTNTRKTGSLKIMKIANATGTFHFDVSCTDGTNPQNIPITIDGSHLGGDGVSAPLISGIPTGTVCTVTEDEDPLFTRVVTPLNGVITISTGTNTVTFTNTRVTGSLRITKIADAAGSFTFDVSCTDGTNPQNIPITIDGAHLNTGVSAPLISGIPTGTVCTVSEDGNELFTTTVAPPGGQVTIDNGTKTVTFTNTRKTGSLKITKIADAAGSFTFDVSCTDGTNPQNIPITIDGAHLNTGVSAPLISGIPTGTVCTVSEDGNELFTTTVAPPGGQVTIDNGTKTVTFTNTRKTGSLKITKIADAAGSFTFDVSCTDGTNPQNIPITIDGAHLNTGVSAPLISGIPTGTVCTVSEDGNELFTTTVAPPGGQVTIDNGTKTVTFTNTRKTGSLKITKIADAAGSFTFDVSCTDGTNPQNIPITIDGAHLNTGVSAPLISGIPTGTVCTVSEDGNELFTTTVDPAGGVVAITTGTKEVTFTNTRRTGSLTISKHAVGGNGTFTFQVDCDDDNFDSTVKLTVADGDTEIAIVHGIPTGTKCTVTEDANNLFSTVVVPADGTVTIDENGATVAFTNTKYGSIEIIKQTDPGNSEQTFAFTSDVPGLFGSTQELRFLAALDVNSAALGDGDSAKAAKVLPTEGGYTVTEAETAGWDLTDLTCVGTDPDNWSASTNDSGALNGSVQIDLQPGEDVVCTFTNTERGSIIVKKQAVGATAADAGDTFTYTGDAAGEITVPIADDEEIRVDNLVPGTYSSTEQFTTGWTLDSISCDDSESDTPSTTNAATSLATFKVDPGETVTCLFRNIKPELTKSSDPSTTDANPTLVPRASTITYTVTVQNPGAAAIPSSALVDSLPAGVSDPFDVTEVQGTWDSYAFDPAGNGKITWMVSLAAHETKVFSYMVTVDATAPSDGPLLNTVTWQELKDSTLHVVGVPVPTLDKFANPVTTDASPALVQPGTRIDYSVKVGNTGNFPITNAPVVDTLPNNVTAVASSISDSGTLSGDGKTITWSVTLAPGASKTLTYAVTVNEAAPQGALLVNTAKFQGLTDTTTHVVPTGALTLVKGVTPVAGNGVVVEFGDTLTYTLTASATGTLNQPNVVVRDYLPGFDPARPSSGKTTYVQGSATCIGGGTCNVSGPDASGRITWGLGGMNAGTSRQVTFQVTIDDVTGAAGATVAADILNAGEVQSDRTPATPSNQVSTPVSKVLPVKVSKPPAAVLPHTGAALPIGPLVGGALALLGLGLLMLTASRRRSWTYHS